MSPGTLAVMGAPQRSGWGTMSVVVRERRTPTAAAVQRRMELGLGALRGVTLAWAVVVIAIDTNSGVLVRPVLAALVLAVLAVWSAWWTRAAAAEARWLGDVGAAIDVVLAALVVVVDQFVYSDDGAQPLGSAWPLVAVLATGVTAGSTWGLLGGLGVGAASLVAAAVDADLGGRVLGLVGATLLYGAAGWVAGWVARQLRTTTQLAAAAEARSEVARTLHDGVLQTLAVVQRRSDDPQLVALAREQDQDLRAFLRSDTSAAAGVAGPAGVGGSSLGGDVEDWVEQLSRNLVLVGRRHQVDVHLVVIERGDGGSLAGSALAAATAEAVTNAARHSGADEVWVSLDGREPSGSQVVVHDEGRGFDPASTPQGDGLRRSVHERLAEVGGGAVVRSSPGTGCDVTLWVP